MTDIPDELRYTQEHEWLRLNDDGTAVVGITAYAQESLGDITFVELPDAGASLGEGETFGVVESVKAASDLYMPLAGEVIELNEALEDDPSQVNRDPYGAGWLVKIRVADTADVARLLDSAAYGELV